MRPIPDIVLAPLIAHPIWAVFMISAPIPIHTMGIDAAYSVTPNPLAATCLMFGASALAWWSHAEKYHGNWRGLWRVLPQQFLMLLSLGTIVVAVLSGTYANKYSPPEGWRFIAADQIFFAVCALLHTRYIWRTYLTKKHER